MAGRSTIRSNRTMIRFSIMFTGHTARLTTIIIRKRISPSIQRMAGVNTVLPHAGSALTEVRLLILQGCKCFWRCSEMASRWFPAELTDDNKLDGEGPFRVVLPQKTPGPPDQRSTAPDQKVIWPFDENADHSAGFSTRTATMIKVEPLPDGTTDVDTLEAGWDFVDEEKLIIYGAIDPLPNILEKMDSLIETLASAGKADFRHSRQKAQLIHKAKIIKKLSAVGRINTAQSQAEKGLSVQNKWMPDGRIGGFE